MLPTLLIKSKAEAQALLDFDKSRLIKKMISIGEPGSSPPHNWRQVDDVLRLEFWDVDRDYENFDAPSAKDVREIVKFARKVQDEAYKGLVLIHCHAGQSRSSAAAYICLSVWNGAGSEEDSLSAVYKLNARARPNPVLIEHADRLLDRNGTMIKAIKSRPAAVPYPRDHLSRRPRG